MAAGGSLKRALFAVGVAVTMAWPAAAAAAAPVIELDPAELHFSARVGHFQGQQFVEVRNTGDAPLEVTELELTGDRPNIGHWFQVSDVCPPSVAPGDDCRIGVQFDAREVGVVNGTVLVHHNAPGAVSEIALTGRGTRGPEIRVTPAQVNFGAHRVGTSSPQRAITVENRGDETLLFSAGFGGDVDQFTVADGCGGPLSPGEECAILVGFTPTRAGAANAAFEIESNTLDGRIRVVRLSGRGTVPGATPPPPPPCAQDPGGTRENGPVSSLLRGLHAALGSSSPLGAAVKGLNCAALVPLGL